MGSSTTRVAGRSTAACLIPLLIVATGCSSAVGPSELDVGLRTEGTSFVMRAEGRWVRADIPYSFSNTTGSAVYIVNCRGNFALGLERWDGDGWQGAWSPVIPLCLSSPIVIEPGGVYVDTLRVLGAEPGSNSFPQFAAEPGSYRIRWHDALSSFQDRLPFGEPIALTHRLSNSFELILD